MKEVVVLGGGFGGVSAVLTLLKNTDREKVRITLIDKNSYHLFKASLYEVATSESSKKSIAIPYKEIFKDKINFVKGEVNGIDTEQRLISLTNEEKYIYDYLIIALGSEVEFFNIEGLKENAFSLRWLEDAVKIREEIEKKYHEKVHVGKELRIIVGGGGFSGTELTAELANYRDRLSKHHKKDPNLVKITVIQGSESLLKELDEKVSSIAQKRLEKFLVNIILGTHIKKVTKEMVETENGQKFDYDVLIWTGGVSANKVMENSNLKTNGRGQLMVDENLLVNGYKNIFAVGDASEYAIPQTNKPAPGVAQIAEEEGKAAAENVARLIEEKDLLPYKYFHSGYIIPLRGRFAVADLKNFRLVGFLGWLLQQLVFLNYLSKILPLNKALMRWNKFEMYLMGHE